MSFDVDPTDNSEFAQDVRAVGLDRATARIDARLYQEWIKFAAEELQRAGFKLKYASLSGSLYFHFPNRTGGMLRLADHSIRKPEGVAAMLTIHDGCFPKNEFKARRMVAEAIGWYFLHTARNMDTTDTPLPVPLPQSTKNQDAI